MGQLQMGQLQMGQLQMGQLQMGRGVGKNQISQVNDDQADNDQAERHTLTLATPWQSQWHPEFIGTLIFVRRGDEVLLIHKKTGHGAGRINAPGGKLDPGETIVACAVRELYEEVGLQVEHAHVGLEMRFVEQQGPQWLGFALVADNFQGEPKESAEAEPFWCPIAEIPYQDMWPDDGIWLPGVLSADYSNWAAPPMDGSIQPPTPVANFLFRNEELITHEFDLDATSIWPQFPF